MQCFALEGGFKPPKISQNPVVSIVLPIKIAYSVYTSRWDDLFGMGYSTIVGPTLRNIHRNTINDGKLYGICIMFPITLLFTYFFGTFFLINILELRFCKQIFLFLLGYPSFLHPYCTLWLFDVL